MEPSTTFMTISCHLRTPGLKQGLKLLPVPVLTAHFLPFATSFLVGSDIWHFGEGPFCSKIRRVRQQVVKSIWQPWFIIRFYLGITQKPRGGTCTVFTCGKYVLTFARILKVYIGYFARF